jgi:hypothetical protein
MRNKHGRKSLTGDGLKPGARLRPAPGPTGREKWWRLVRITLGLAQIMAATATAYLLAVTGVTNLTLWALAGTGLLVVLSKLLFREPHA